MAEETYPSRLLDDVPVDLLAGRTRTGRNLKGGVPETRWATTEGSVETKWSLHKKPTPFDRTQGKPASIIEAKFRAGTRVKHPTWGEGIVLDSRIQDNDEIVDVVFNSVGIKRLSVSLANLQTI